TTPLPGAGIDPDKVPASVYPVDAAQIRQTGSFNISDALVKYVPGTTVNDVAANPFQPNVQFRGFVASPVSGTPQGLAVYQNGVRINEAFGDTVNWDLFPDLAIGRVDVVGANPVYGLNALGGAIVLTMKTGFDFQGGTLEASGGSWGQRQGWIQYGTNAGRWGWYVAGRLLKQDGWRKFSPDSLS